MRTRGDHRVRVVFDGECALCQTLKRRTQERDVAGTLDFVAYQDTDLKKISPDLTPTMASESLVLVRRDGTILRGAGAVFEILKHLPGLWRLAGAVLSLPLVRSLAEPFYRIVARHRRHISLRLSTPRFRDHNPKLSQIPVRQHQDKRQLLNALLKDIEHISTRGPERLHILQHICHLLTERVPHYHWAGFYLVDQSSGGELLLGAFSGEPTPHARIALGQGICGQAAQRKATFLVQDVSKERSYLSCSPRVRSEIVVPILKAGRVVAEIDIDSHNLAAFDDQDVSFLETLSQRLASLF